MAASKVLSADEPVILSVLGHYKKDPDGIFLLGNLLSEQIKERIPKATIFHVVLEDQETIRADGKDANFIGFTRPLGYPDKATPSTEWLNFFLKAFYPHLAEYKVSHIIAHAPDFIWGAVNMKVDFFPEAAILTVIHEQIEMYCMSTNRIETHPRQELEKWSKFAEVMVSLGQHTFDDVENLLCCLEKTFDKDKKLCYLPSTPKHFRNGGPWKKPPDTRTPTITILAGNNMTQEKQKMALPIIISAITSVAEDLHRAEIVRKLVVRITGVPRDESMQVKESLEPYMNAFVTLECVEAFSFQELEREIKGSYLCIIPLGSSTEAYGLDFMVPVGFGAPTLVPDSASIVWDAREIVSPGDLIHLKQVVVGVMYAKSKENEERAWKDKIMKVLTNMAVVQTSAGALRQAINQSNVLAENIKDFIKLLKVPAQKIPQQRSSPLGNNLPPAPSLVVYEAQSTRVQQPFQVDKPRYYYPHGDPKVGPSSDPQVINPDTKMGRFLRNWVLFVRLIPLYPMVDVMLEQGSISYAVFDEVYERETTSDCYAAMSSLLSLVRRRGDLGIDQFCKALREPTVGLDIFADRVEGQQNPV